MVSSSYLCPGLGFSPPSCCWANVTGIAVAAGRKGVRVFGFLVFGECRKAETCLGNGALIYFRSGEEEDHSVERG